MKPHFGRQVIERARGGSSNPSAKARMYGKITLDDEGFDYEGFTKLSSSRRKNYGLFPKLGEKNLSDVLGPIYGYLRSKCGTPWDSVYSEIRRELGRSGSEGIRHIVDAHINVDTNCWRGVSGKVYSDGKYGPQEVGKSYRTGDFYVEPETGLLREAVRSKSWRREDAEKRAAGFVRDSNWQWVRRPIIVGNGQLEKIDGIWYYVEYGEIERKVLVKVKSETGPDVYRFDKIRDILVKRQLGKKELQKFNLKND